MGGKARAPLERQGVRCERVCKSGWSGLGGNKRPHLDGVLVLVGGSEPERPTMIVRCERAQEEHFLMEQRVTILRWHGGDESWPRNNG